jgi:hypothetical protein
MGKPSGGAVETRRPKREVYGDEKKYKKQSGYPKNLRWVTTH